MTVKRFLIFVLVFLLFSIPNISAYASDTSNTEEAPEFLAELCWGGNGPTLFGFFSGIFSGMQRVRPYYSFDGVNYQPVCEEGSADWVLNGDFNDQITLERQKCADASKQPVKSYAAGLVNMFYIKLRITETDREYDTKPFQIIRSEQAQPLPEDVAVYAIYPSSMRVGFGARAQIKYNVTVREGITPEELQEFLPMVLPIEIQLSKAGGNLLAQTFVEYGVDWNLPDVIPTGGITVPDAIAAFYPPKDLEIKTLDNIYNIKPPAVEKPLQLIINTVPEGSKITPELHVGTVDFMEALCMTIPLKPSGAKEILLHYSMDGGETWTQTQDILSYNKSVDAFPKNSDYNYVTLFKQDQSPYKEYIAGEIGGFLVRIDIIGGTLDGQGEFLSWPIDYIYEPPQKDNGDNGSGGNRGDVGAGNTEDDSSANGGQRPGLSDDDEKEEPDKPELPPAVELPPIVELPPAAELPPAVELPPIVELPPAAELPPVVELPPIVELPPAAELPPIVELPPATELPPVVDLPPLDMPVGGRSSQPEGCEDKKSDKLEEENLFAENNTPPVTKSQSGNTPAKSIVTGDEHYEPAVSQENETLYYLSQKEMMLLASAFAPEGDEGSSKQKLIIQIILTLVVFIGSNIAVVTAVKIIKKQKR